MKIKPFLKSLFTARTPLTEVTTPITEQQIEDTIAELHEHLAGRLDLSRAVELIKRNSRHYARRQLSWYRGQAQVEWATADRVDLADLAAYLTASPP